MSMVQNSWHHVTDVPTAAAASLKQKLHATFSMPHMMQYISDCYATLTTLDLIICVYARAPAYVMIQPLPE